MCNEKKKKQRERLSRTEAHSKSEGGRKSEEKERWRKAPCITATTPAVHTLQIPFFPIPHTSFAQTTYCLRLRKLK